MISAAGNKIDLDDGYTLAIIDKEEKIIRKGESVQHEIFSAMKDQVIRGFCNHFRSIKPEDFKQ
ncbi:hypothetical protein ACOCGN_001720 [Vibrio cholerae]